ncbi:MAG: outer membrane beta-barrel protein [Bryobacteraceae bacterium]
MKQILWFAGLAWAALAPLCGQTVEVSVLRGWARMSKTPLGSSSPVSPKDTDTTFRNGYSNGLRLTWNPHRYYGYELGYLQTRATLRVKTQASKDVPKETLDRTVKLHQAFIDFLVYWMPKNERFRPFFALGAQAQKSISPRNVPSWSGYSTRNYGFHYGLGMKIRLFQHAQVRLDARDCLTGKPYDLDIQEIMSARGNLRHQEASVGIGLTF